MFFNKLYLKVESLKGYTDNYIIKGFKYFDQNNILYFSNFIAQDQVQWETYKNIVVEMAQE